MKNDNYYIKQLPDAFNKLPDSNNKKLLDINYNALYELKNDISSVYDMLDLEYAFGKILDLYGNMLGQTRGRLNDIQYRVFLRGIIAKNLCRGDYASVIEAVSLIFNCDKSAVSFEEIEDEICVVYARKLPYAVISMSEFSAKEAIELIEDILPVTVRLKADNLEGTFEFGETEDILNGEITGFSEDLKGLKGGHFGAIYGFDDTKGIPV